MPLLARRALAFLAASAAAALGCQEVGSDEGSSETQQLEAVVNNCSGAAISAAVAAGGEVILDCGPNPVVIDVPATNVGRSGSLRARTPGTITLTHRGTLFSIRGPISFDVDGIQFRGGSVVGMAIHGAQGASIVLNNARFTGYAVFPVSVHGSRLTVAGSTFADNGLGAASSFATAIYIEGSTVDVRSSLFSNNRSVGLGGAITSFGNLTVTGSTFVNNRAGRGGAIGVGNGGTQVISNSTFVNNSAAHLGGAIESGSGASVTITNSTFSENTSPTGTFRSSGTLQMNASVLVDSGSPAGCQIAGQNNLQWPALRPLCGAGFRYGNPLLRPLAANGGPTPTMALGDGSQAIDAVFSSCPLTDQRGIFRPRDGNFDGRAVCDAGAFER